MSEAYTSVPNVMRYYVSDDRRKIGSHFAFNFMLINDVGPDTNAEGFKTIVLDRWFDALPEGRTSNWVLGNHDRPRIASRYGSDRVSALLTLEMTLPGVAITYYVSF
jgi:alpha-glucosidase